MTTPIETNAIVALWDPSKVDIVFLRLMTVFIEQPFPASEL